MRSVHTVGASNVMYINCDAGHDYGHHEGGFTNEELDIPCPYCAEIAELIAIKEEHESLGIPKDALFRKLWLERKAAMGKEWKTIESCGFFGHPVKADGKCHCRMKKEAEASSESKTMTFEECRRHSHPTTMENGGCFCGYRSLY